MFVHLIPNQKNILKYLTPNPDLKMLLPFQFWWTDALYTRTEHIPTKISQLHN